MALIYIITDLQHHLYRLTLDDKLYLSPIKDNVQNVLDIGTGTGIWAIEFGLC
jgi:methylase of polypeptide subunit release factors